MADPARRVRDGRLAEVRPRVGPPGAGPAAVPAADRAQPAAGLRRAPRRRRGPPGGLRGADQRRLVAQRAGPRPPVADAGAARAALRRAPRPLRRRRPRRRAPDGARGRGRVTWDTLAPLALPDLPDAIAQRLVDEVLRAPRFADGVPLPAVALDDPAHSSRETWWGRHRHWRGPSLGQQRLVRLARACAGSASTPRPTRMARAPDARSSRARASASTTRRARATAWARTTSAGRRCCGSWSTRPPRPPPARGRPRADSSAG